MSSDCRFHVAITPYSKLIVPESIKAVDVELFQPADLERRVWPRVGTQRIPEGGVGGDIVGENIVVTWIENKRLIYTRSENAQPLAEKRHSNEICYLASYVAQLDGAVAYSPVPGTLTNYMILVEDQVAQTHAIRFSPRQVAVVGPFVKHSLPIPFSGHFEFTAWHRAVNASIQLRPDSAGLQTILVNLNKVNRISEVGIRHVEQAKESTKKQPHLPSSFSKEIKPLVDATAEDISAYGSLIPDYSLYEERVTAIPWPHSDASFCSTGALKQEFVMAWRPVEEQEGLFELEFEGLSGSLAGEKGRPGVSYNAELGIYSSDLFMARPDGSFYVQPFLHSETFVMALAQANKENGEPVENTLRAFIFRNGNAVRLNPGVWHSVPIPLAGSDPIVFTEYVADTNAHIVANVKAETGHPIQFVQAI